METNFVELRIKIQHFYKGKPGEMSAQLLSTCLGLNVLSGENKRPQYALTILPP